MKLGLQLRTSQNLALTPQLQQAIRLLLLSTVEMQQEVQEMMESNPFLEEGESTPAEKTTVEIAPPPPLQTVEAVPELSEMDWGQNNSTDSNLTTDDEWQITDAEDTSSWGTTTSSSSRQASSTEDGESDIFDTYTVDISLTEHLMQQARTLHTTPEDTAALTILIGSLNENGYITDELDDIADQLLINQQTDPSYLEQYDDLFDRLTHTLLLLQSMEPAGIGARSLSECLTIQLKQQPKKPMTDLALQLVGKHLDAMARRDFRKISSHTQSTEQEVREAFQLVLTLNPKPGRQFSSETEPIVIPDVIVQRTKTGWEASLNPEVMPNIQVNDIYANALRQHKGKDGTEALGQRLQEARWFIRNIQQRFDTILRVSQAIIDRQKNFFNHGEVAMRPLVLREIADEIEMHESTISRVTTAKYMLTPFGVYELKYFFGSGLDTDAGGSASSTAVKALIKKLVSNEDPKKPLSDSAISQLLEDQGIQVARRTIAKYRDELKIPTTTLRKAI